MSDNFLDFFAGYEEEPAHLFFLDGRLRLRCWKGHLSAFLDTVPAEQGRWTGLAEAYHLDPSGEHSWRVIDCAACLTQLQQVRMRDGLSADYAEQANEVRLALLKLFQDAVSTGGEIIVRRD